ncbi:helix-turn-helix domain-containing protein [Streptomyces sp. NPDC029006]|uniref:helix-turn-helix domain-containing protein n=1 Tax=Streptomyces sp. NPDC029006 TaxID=3155467 RepID=UPI0033D3D41D
MIAAAQWLHATTGRIATCPHSWMTAVHWVDHLAKKGLYTPTQTHGPKWGPTTLAVAQEIAALKECRPGIDYLARKLNVSERTVQYHLGMLREAGLLVYRSKGTRISGVGGRASEFERVIPVQFDEALGIRTVGEGATRRPVGAAAESRSLLGKLAKKAARKVRRTPVSARSRCTPMQVGTSGTSTAAGTHYPSEAKLASGKKSSPTRKQPKRGPRTLNRVGRRYQLARELIAQVPWLRGAAVPRIAWIVRHVADEGWTVLEVQAAAERYVSDREPKRPSAVLAFRLSSCHLLYTTPDRRKVLVEDWQDSRRAEQARHSEADYSDLGDGPRSVAARRAMDEAFAAIRDRLAPAPEPVEESGPLGLEDLTRDEIVQMRLDAMADPSLIFISIELAGEQYTRRLYTNRLVDQTLALEAINARRNTLTPAF